MMRLVNVALALFVLLAYVPLSLAQPLRECARCHSGVYPLPEFVAASCDCHEASPRRHTKMRNPDLPFEEVHRLHANLGVGLLVSPGCAECHLIRDVECTKCHENPHPEERARELQCSECHAPLPSWSYHGEVELGGRHAMANMSCTTCHNASAPAELYLVSNGTAALTPIQVCWQCHPREYRLWQEGKHFSNASCISEGCHDPHNPALSALPDFRALAKSLLGSVVAGFGIFIASSRIYWVRRWRASRSTTE